MSDAEGRGEKTKASHRTSLVVPKSLKAIAESRLFSGKRSRGKASRVNANDVSDVGSLPLTLPTPLGDDDDSIKKGTTDLDIISTGVSGESSTSTVIWRRDEPQAVQAQDDDGSADTRNVQDTRSKASVDNISGASTPDVLEARRVQIPSSQRAISCSTKSALRHGGDPPRSPFPDEALQGPAPKLVRFAGDLETKIPVRSSDDDFHSDMADAGDDAGDAEKNEDADDNDWQVSISGSSRLEEPAFWRMTESTLAAYTSMRGIQHDNDVDTKEWQNRFAEVARGLQRLEAQSSPEARARIGVLKERLVRIPRPSYEHLDDERPCLADTVHFSDLYDISDDEGDSRDGRISPCTFRLWADGVAAANAKKEARSEPDQTWAAISTMTRLGQKGGSRRNVPKPCRLDDETSRSSIPGADEALFRPQGVSPKPDTTVEVSLWQERMEEEAGRLGSVTGLGEVAVAGEALAVADDARSHTDAARWMLTSSWQEIVHEATRKTDRPTLLDGVAVNQLEGEFRLCCRRLEDAWASAESSLKGKNMLTEKIRLRRTRVQHAARVVGTLQCRAREKQHEQHEQRRRRRHEAQGGGSGGHEEEDAVAAQKGRHHIEQYLRVMSAQAAEVEALTTRLWTEIGALVQADEGMDDTVRQMGRAIGIVGLEPEEMVDKIMAMGDEDA
ncbi:hypothetical protein RJ55_00190 [Drechmeria coniospora]|nr:hypothetical protein RJ55_00190 [Drechmeria coniospora]